MSSINQNTGGEDILVKAIIFICPVLTKTRKFLIVSLKMMIFIKFGKNLHKAIRFRICNY